LAARERVGRLTTILKRFLQSLLAAACSGRLTADWRELHEARIGIKVKRDFELSDEHIAVFIGETAALSKSDWQWECSASDGLG
jgi:hypothetical protein